MRRRTFLTATAVIGTILNTGCVGSIQDSLDSSIRLGWVGVHNDDPDQHEFQIQVFQDGEMAHDSTYEIRGREENVVHGEVAECTWGNSAASYVVRGRVDGGQWIEKSIDDALDGTPNCATAHGLYDDVGSGELEFFIDENCSRVPRYDGGCSFAN